jgi:hypothetical protein
LTVFFTILLGPPPQEFAIDGMPISSWLQQLKDGDTNAAIKIGYGRKASVLHLTRAILASRGKGVEFSYLTLAVYELPTSDAAACIPVLLFVRNMQNAKTVDQLIDRKRKMQ